MARVLGASRGLWITLGLVSGLFLLSRTGTGSQIAMAAGDFLLNTTRGIRNNNPGNIVRTNDVWQGESPDQSGDDRFVVFTAPEWGIRAMVRILRRYYSSGLTTVSQIISQWAPSTENDTQAYIDAVANQMGVSPDGVLSFDNALPLLVSAIITHENGQQPYDISIIDKGIALEASS